MRPKQKSKSISILVLLFFSCNVLTYIYLNYSYRKNGELQSKIIHENLQNYWINKIQERDSITLALISNYENTFTTSILKDNDPIKNRLIISIPEEACWECVKEKLDLINNKSLDIEIFVFAPKELLRNIQAIIYNNKFINNYEFATLTNETKHPRNFYFLFCTQKAIYPFVDISNSNELLESYINQMK